MVCQICTLAACPKFQQLSEEGMYNQCDLGTSHCSQSLKGVWRWQYPGNVTQRKGVYMLRDQAGDAQMSSRQQVARKASGLTSSLPHSCHYSVHNVPAMGSPPSSLPSLLRALSSSALLRLQPQHHFFRGHLPQSSQTFLGSSVKLLCQEECPAHWVPLAISAHCILSYFYCLGRSRETDHRAH